MAHLRFTAAAESQLQRAHQELNGTDQQPVYDRLVATLIHLERDAALFTLIEATTLPHAEHDLYGVVLEVDSPGTPVVIAYGLHDASEDVVIFQISW